MPRKSLLCAAGAVFFTACAAIPSVAQICVADPIIPPCCPSPCPIIDLGRVPKLLSDVDSLKQSIDSEKQIVQSALQMSQAVGGAISAGRALGGQFHSLGNTVSNEITSLQTGLPTNSAAALNIIRQSLFIAAGEQKTASQNRDLALSRQAAAQAEQIGAYAVSLQSFAVSSSASQPQGAATSQQLHGDIASNSLSRLEIYQSANHAHQLIAALLSQESAGSALSHSMTGGGGAPSAPPPIASSGASTDGSPTLAQAVNQLISLHDARVEGQALLSSYPALQQTVTSASMAAQFANDAEVTLKQSLLAAGLSGSVLPDIQKSLLLLDPSGWLDSGKALRSQQAAAMVLATLNLGGGSTEQNSVRDQVQSAMASWLDADKQSRYWAALSGEAQQVIKSLDAQLGSLSDRIGTDVIAPSAASQEQALLRQVSVSPVSSPWNKLIDAARQDPSAQSVITSAGRP